MTVRVFIILLGIVFFIGVSGAGAEMSSTNYKIPYSVFSGGGGYKNSSNFESEDTLGQPSPLMEDELAPSSTNYINHPGFWNLVAAANRTCPGDYEWDYDVDGVNLYDFLVDDQGVSISDFALNFGKIDCQNIVP